MKPEKELSHEEKIQLLYDYIEQLEYLIQTWDMAVQSLLEELQKHAH